MKPELLEKLLDAGFTKDEIFRLARDEPEKKSDPEPEKKSDPEPEKKSDPEPEKKPDPEPEKKPAPEPEKKPDPEPDKTAEKLNGIEKAIEELRKAVQANNVRNDSFGDREDSLEAQTDKIMASIIRPEPAGKDGAK